MGVDEYDRAEYRQTQDWLVNLLLSRVHFEYWKTQDWLADKKQVDHNRSY